MKLQVWTLIQPPYGKFSRLAIFWSTPLQHVERSWSTKRCYTQLGPPQEHGKIYLDSSRMEKPAVQSVVASFSERTLWKRSITQRRRQIL